MKKITLMVGIIASFAVLTLIYACGRGMNQVSFVKSANKTMKQMLAEAKSKNKILFVDVYTTWCGPCRWMDENTLRDVRVGEKFNKTFLNYKVDGDSFEGVNVGILYRVDSYPTYLFIDSNGQVLYRIEGTMTVEGLVKAADFAINQRPAKEHDLK
jgi:thiol:disulfide interchange protein